MREREVENSNYRVGHFPSEMLRRAMEDARKEERARTTSTESPTASGNTASSATSSAAGAPIRSSASVKTIYSAADLERIGQEQARQQSSSQSRSGKATSAAAPKSNQIEEEESLAPAVTPWHQVLIERFFTAPPPVDPLRKNGRLYTALILFILGFTAVVGKLFKVQVLNHDELSKQAANQYEMQVAIPAKRGLIRDRNGAILATNAFVVKFAVDPKSIQQKEKLAEKFAAVFHKPAKSYLDVFKDTTRRYVVLEREVPQEIAAQLDSVKDHGLIREVESRRHYAFENRASHIVGFTSKDGRGLAGIELLMNKQLSGQNGSSIMQRDGRGMRRPDVDYDKTDPVDGSDITLTIDESIQSFAEEALRKGVETAKAEAGIAIVMNPKTGEILALADAPDFNPNEFGKASNDALRNRAITDAFEPGSTIKLITAAAALEEGVMKPDDRIDAEGGTWTIEGGAKIRDTHPYGTLTFRGALEKSSNVCFAKISDKLEKKRYYKYLRDFGLGVLSGIDLPGEIKGYVSKPDKWGINSKRYMAFGYELTATALQMATAYATIANMGVMMKPHVISKVVGPDGKEEEVAPQEIRRVVSEKTCRTLIDMMRGVVDSGTATLVRIKGLSIAGKTGTAQQLVNGHYSKEHYTSSFTGFFPAENPEYMISVILRSPHNGYYGGAVSGPIWREIAMRILEMNGKLPPEARAPVQDAKPKVDEGAVVEIEGTILKQQRAEESREMPDVKGLSIEAGKSLLASQGFVVLNTATTGVVDRIEKVGEDTVRIVARHSSPEESKPDDHLVAPDFLGMPISRAMKVGTMSGVRTKVVGQGKVKSQVPAAGAPLDRQNPIITLFGDE